MSRLVLVRHAMPQIDPTAPSKTWRLSAEGWGAATRLAHKLADLGPGRVVASPEPKAEDTGRVIAEAINWPFAVDAGLAEHARETVGFLPKDELDAKIARLFAEPDSLALGEETANQALGRFSAAIERHRGHDTLLAAAHGTVITLVDLRPLPAGRHGLLARARGALRAGVRGRCAAAAGD